MLAQVSQAGADKGKRLRACELIQQIVTEHELEIIYGNVARDHVHVFLT